MPLLIFRRCAFISRGLLGPRRKQLELKFAPAVQARGSAGAPGVPASERWPPALTAAFGALETRVKNRDLLKDDEDVVRRCMELLATHADRVFHDRQELQISGTPGFLDRVVVYDGSELHVRAHIFRADVEDTPHDHGQNFFSFMVAGDYFHELVAHRRNEGATFQEWGRLPGGEITQCVEKQGELACAARHEHIIGQLFFLSTDGKHKVIADRVHKPVTIIVRAKRKQKESATFQSDKGFVPTDRVVPIEDLIQRDRILADLREAFSYLRCVRSAGCISRLTPRPYQLAALEQVRRGSSILAMAPNSGKTYVAALAIRQCLEAFPDKRAAFVVPTNPLVEQQVQEIQQCPECAEYSVAKVTKDDVASELSCRKLLHGRNVLVGTSELFRTAFQKRYAPVSAFALMVFDECHNARGNSPMAMLAQEVTRVDAASRPRILGLTATIEMAAVRSKSSVEATRLHLEALLDASIFSPDHVADEVPVERVPHDRTEDAQLRSERFAAIVDGVFRSLLSSIDPQSGMARLRSDLLKRQRQAAHVFAHCGAEATVIYVEKCIVAALEGQVKQMEDFRRLNDPAFTNENAELLHELQQALPCIQESIASFAAELRGAFLEEHAPAQSSKLSALSGLLKNRLPGTKGIVYVDQVALTLPLALVLARDLAPRSASAVYGAMPAGERDNVLHSFRRSTDAILVSTNVLDEGMNIGDCWWVAHFNGLSTTRSYVQGRGRARMGGGAFYFENDPEWEDILAKELDRVTKNKALGLTPEERERCRLAGYACPSPDVYPTRSSTDARIDLWNCQKIVENYCSKVLGQRFSPENITRYSKAGDLEAVRIPCLLPDLAEWQPDGFAEVTCAQVDSRWGGLSLEQALSPDERQRLKRLSLADREKRRALYAAAVFMHEHGLIDEHTNPSPKAVLMAQACAAECGPLMPRASVGRIPNRFRRHGQTADAPRSGGPHPELL